MRRLRKAGIGLTVAGSLATGLIGGYGGLAKGLSDHLTRGIPTGWSAQASLSNPPATSNPGRPPRLAKR